MPILSFPTMEVDTLHRSKKKVSLILFVLNIHCDYLILLVLAGFGSLDNAALEVIIN